MPDAPPAWRQAAALARDPEVSAFLIAVAESVTEDENERAGALGMAARFTGAALLRASVETVRSMQREHPGSCFGWVSPGERQGADAAAPDLAELPALLHAFIVNLDVLGGHSASDAVRALVEEAVAIFAEAEHLTAAA